MADDQQVRWAGVDWANASHTVCIIDAHGASFKTFVVENSPQGMVALATALQGIAGVAIETNHGNVVSALLQAGLPVYAVNPKVAKRQREIESTAGSKSDALDAHALAELVRTRHDRMRPLRPTEEQLQVLTTLCNDEVSLIGDRTALIEQLEDVLKEYYPGVLPYFDDWTAPGAWHFVKRFPTPQDLMAAHASTIIKQLRTTRMPLTQERQQLIDARSEQPRWPSNPAFAQAKARRALAVIGMLLSIENSLKAYRSQINEIYNQLPDAGLLDSLPGVGKKLGPRLLALIGTDRDRYDSAQPLQMLSGTAPALDESGNRRVVRKRQACQTLFRTTMHQMAYCSICNCAWARAFYQIARARGDGHAAALRKLAFKWLKIIYRVWSDRVPYNEAKYLNALIRHNSPVIAEMQKAKSGG